jgi:hypothetical protein
MQPFPIFRKLEGFDRFYHIRDERTFVEAYKQGGVFKLQQVSAEQYPEMLRIQDMIQCNFQFVEMTAAEIASIFNVQL